MMSHSLRSAEVMRRNALSVLRGRRKGAQYPVLPMAGDAMTTGDDRGMHHAAEQYRHFTDWVYAAVRPIAQRIAGQPIRVARVKQRGNRATSSKAIELAMLAVKSGEHADLDVLDQHPILDLLCDPNELMVAWSLKYSTVASLELTGRSFWLMGARTDDDGSRRPEVWPIPTSWVQPDHKHHAWKVTYPGTAQPKLVPWELMLHFCYPDPADPLGAISPLQTQARAVTADESIQTAQVAAFANGIHPGLAIIVGNDSHDGRPPLLEVNQRQQIINAIKQRYRGVMRFDEPIILDALIRDIKRISNKPAEMDFLNSGKQTKGRIFQGFGINPVIAGELEGVNRATAAVADDHFCNSTLNPKIELLSQILTGWLGPIFAQPGEQLVVWLECCRPSDPEQTRADFELGLKFGAVTRNEYRQRVLGLGPMSGGDVPLTPASLLPG